MDLRVEPWRRLSTEELMFWTVGLRKTLESPLDSKEIKPVSPKGWISTLNIYWIDWCWTWSPIFWPPDAMSWLTGKGSDAGKDRRQKEKGATENEMVGWHHQFKGHEFEQIPGDREGQGSLLCCSPAKSQTHWATKQQHPLS